MFQTFAKQDSTSTTEFEYLTKHVTCTTCIWICNKTALWINLAPHCK